MVLNTVISLTAVLFFLASLFKKERAASVMYFVLLVAVAIELFRINLPLVVIVLGFIVFATEVFKPLARRKTMSLKMKRELSAITVLVLAASLLLAYVLFSRGEENIQILEVTSQSSLSFIIPLMTMITIIISILGIRIWKR